MNMTRKDFLKSAAATTALAASAGLMGTASAAAESFENSISWDAEFDVVVVGYGFAGASSAITAAEEGAKVLLVDKAPLNHEGGNSRYCAQLCMYIKPEERDMAITYYEGLRGRYTHQSDEVIECIVDGLMGNYQWFLDHGMAAEDIIVMSFPEYPEFDGAKSAYALLHKGSWMSQFYQYVQALVPQYENIRRWNSCEVVELIQDPVTKIIHGVVVDNYGDRYNVRAKNGVIMALGGFENNQHMLENFVQQPGAYGKGARYNTGDGVKMAISVGADLWHMSTLSGADVNFIDPMTNVAAGYALTSHAKTNYCPGFMRFNAIIVGGEGKRFINESYFPRHGHINYGGTYRSMLIPDNCWCIFDETARNTEKAYYSWSDGMVEEIEKGWIKKADTLEELAAMCGIKPEGLVEQVKVFNECCATGNDYMYGRSADYLCPLETAPYYAFELRPTNTNTQGGARRNTKCEIVTPYDEPIPHLYSAGEFGSFYADVYNGGGNVGECFFTGRIAGKAAAAVKDDVTQESLLTKEPVDFFQTRPEFTAENENEHIGVCSTGIGGDLVVKVTMDGKTMKDIQVLYHNETPNIGTKAIREVTAAMLEKQSTVVDTVAGCTVTSYALMNAVNDALKTGIVVSSKTDLEELEASRKASVDQIGE